MSTLDEHVTRDEFLLVSNVDLYGAPQESRSRWGCQRTNASWILDYSQMRTSKKNMRTSKNNVSRHSQQIDTCYNSSIYFIFLPLPNTITPKKMALPFPRAPPPSNLFPCTSSVTPVCFWLVVESKTLIGGHLRPQCIFLNYIFVDQLNGQNNGAVTPCTFHPSRTSSLIYKPTRMPTSI